ncbi:MAG: alanine--glyoxylate aminotransferase family protein [Gemmatimonadota bacterium]
MSVPSHSAEAFGRFFLPGPTEVRPEVLEALLRPMIGHRGPDMKALLAAVDPGLRALFGTERPVFISTSSATGFMETAIVNLCARRTLCVIGGAFAERFHKIAARCGREADVLEVEWGEPNTADSVRQALAASPGVYDLVTVVHSETSTGVLNPIQDIAAAVHEFEDVLLAVDSVSSLAGAELYFDDWKLDFLLTGSQKALALPPGLAFAAASERALDRARGIPQRSYYFDLVDFDRRAREHQTANTPALSLIYALEVQLGRIAAEGLSDRWARHAAMAARTYSWVDHMSATTGEPFRILARDGYRSPTVSAVVLPDALTGPQITAALGERGFTIAPGYGSMKDDIIRIGHMGDHTAGELELLLEALTEIVGNSLGAPV